MAADRVIAGRYHLEDEIGRGGMGVVWRAHDSLLDRNVAVKELLVSPGLSLAQADEASHRALREGRIAARLHHPNAIAVYDVAEVDGNPWLVMEYLPSQSLAVLLEQRGSLSHQEAARIGASIAAALTAAHAAGIVHRDVKPGNILIGNHGQVKITDFGISRAIGDVTVTATGMVSGTPAYLAPEVARGEDPAPPADVYALGALLYLMVEGKPPYRDTSNTLALLHTVAAGQTEPPSTDGPLIPLLNEMMRYDPRDRPSMRQVFEYLQCVAAGVTPRPLVADASQVGADPDRTQATPKVSASSKAARVSAPTQATRAIGGRNRAGAATGRHSGASPEATSPYLGTATSRPLTPRDLRKAPVPVPKSGKKASGVVTLVLVVGLLALAVAIGMYFLGRSGDHHTKAMAAGTSTAVPVTGDPNSTETMSDFVRKYYSLLPDNPQAAWTLLDPNYQSQQTEADYDDFWNTVKSVDIRSITPGNNGSVNVKLTYSMKNGSAKTECRWIAVVDNTDKNLVLYNTNTFACG